MRDDPITRLAAANPVPHDGRLQARETQGHGLRRRRITLGIVVAAGIIAVVLAATPAWALVRDVLPFWNQPTAPQSIKVDFSTLNSPDAPPGMSANADVADTREVMQADLGGKTRTLYVSPAKNSGYCFEWSDSVGGCNTVPQQQPLDVSSSQGPPHDASQPPVTRIPISEMDTAQTTFVSYWMAIDAVSPTIASVVIQFSDGTTVQPQLTWVSAPINAGFYAYEVPNDKQSATDHVTEVRAYDANGNLVETQPMAPMASPTYPHR